MPPIFGIINTKLEQPEPEVIDRMNRAAQYIKSRKLKTLELTGAYLAAAVVQDHPLVPASDTMEIFNGYAIIADASLYKRNELINRLGNIEAINTASDASLILHSFLKWHSDFLQYIYGDFTFVIFNLHSGDIYCARDAMGVRPFFYTWNKDIFIFGSELRYVLDSFAKKPDLRKDYLLDTLVTVKSAKYESPFENIFRLKPGFRLCFSSGTFNIDQYWKVNPDKAIRLSNEEEYIALFREKLCNAVILRCMEVPILGSELSGGIDSSTVTSIAADFKNAKRIGLTAFSNVFPKHTGIKFMDEQEFIHSMLAYKTIEWVGIDHVDFNILELLQYAIDIQGCFIQQIFNIFNRGIYEMAGKRGVQALLSGFGGDEMVSARMVTSWNEIISERQWEILKKELFYDGITMRSLLKFWFITFRYLISRMYQPKSRTGIFSSDLISRRFSMLPIQPSFATRFALMERFKEKNTETLQESISRRQYNRIMMNHIPQRMEYSYAAAAQYGIEYRYPLLDLDLIETCLTFPPWIKHRKAENRYLFRQATKGMIPEEIRLRDDKSGTTIPHIYHSLLNEKALIINLVHSCSNSSYLQGIFDFSRFSDWYEKLKNRVKNDLNYLMPGAFYTYLMILLYFKKQD